MTRYFYTHFVVVGLAFVSLQSLYKQSGFDANSYNNQKLMMF